MKNVFFWLTFSLVVTATFIYFTLPATPPNPAELVQKQLASLSDDLEHAPGYTGLTYSEVPTDTGGVFVLVPYIAEDKDFKYETAILDFIARIIHAAGSSDLQFMEPDPIRADCQSRVYRYKGVVLMHATKTAIIDGKSRTFILLLAKVRESAY